MLRSERLKALRLDLETASDKQLQAVMRRAIKELTHGLPALQIDLYKQIAAQVGVAATDLFLWFRTTTGSVAPDYREPVRASLIDALAYMVERTCDTLEDVADKVEHEGLDYYIQCYTSADTMPNAEMARAFLAAQEALNKFESLIHEGDEEESDADDE